MNYDQNFIENVSELLQEADLNGYPQEVRNWYGDLADYCSNVLTIWEERYGTSPPLANTVAGEVVSNWINQYRGDELFDCTLTTKLGILADDRDANVEKPIFLPHNATSVSL